MPKYLTLSEKSNLLEEYQKGLSVTKLAEKYQIAKSTVCAIINKKRNILKSVSTTFCGHGKRLTMKKAELPLMEKKLYQWFLKQRRKNLPVTGDIIKAKAKNLHEILKENNLGFQASDGWLTRFKKRYGIRFLKISGEKLSSQPELIEPFKKKLHNKIQELGLTADQIYNADESGLYWKLLPEKTFVSSQEKTAPGRKTEKQRITFMACTNASGEHKLRLLVIGKAKNPRCFKKFICPADYFNSKSSWMTQFIFKDWFFHSFVPQVIKSQRIHVLNFNFVLFDFFYF